MRKFILLICLVIAFSVSCKKDIIEENKAITEEEYQGVQIPVVITNMPIDVTVTSAICSGKVSTDGNSDVIERGIVCHIEPKPTLGNNSKKIVEGKGRGEFSCVLTNLIPGTKYYICAFATNQLGTAYGDEIEITTTSNTDIEMIKVEGGSFQMGSNYGFHAESPVHSVTLSSFEIGKYEVTQALWEKVMGSNPSYFIGENLPVELVYFRDIQTFIEKLNEQIGLNYRLPTEAEWEYAARGGNQSKGYTYSGSNTIGDVAWYVDNSGGKTHEVATKTANELGIYDMTGNVWEWCSDWYSDSYYSNSPTENPTGPTSGSVRVIRGAGWYKYAISCRVAYRYSNSPFSSNSGLGFRLCRSL